MEMLWNIKEQDGITLIVSLHNIELATRYAERIVGIKEGAIVFDKSATLFTAADVERIYGAAARSEKVKGDCVPVRYAHA